MEYTFEYFSPLGRLTLASNGSAVTGLWLAGQKRFAATLAADNMPAKLEIFDEMSRQLDEYFDGERTIFSLPLAPRGTEFSRTVWALLRDIPYGSTVTYGEIAAALAASTGKSCSARAVGSAVGRNPVSIIIPCHRVIAADGGLRGYAGGLAAKQKLLSLEKR